MTRAEEVPAAKAVRLVREMQGAALDPGHFVDVLCKLTAVELVTTMAFAEAKAARKRRR